MDYRILGPLLVTRDAAPVTLGPRRNAVLLTLLLLHANEAVSSDQLAEELWSDELPAHPRKALQLSVLRLRRALGAEVLETRSAGYLIRVGEQELDAWRFERLAAAGRKALGQGEARRASALLQEALDLWRGPALAEVLYEPFARSAAARLEEARLCCLEDRIDADLALGRHAALAGELDALTALHGTRERLHGQRMLALYRSGRQADALDVYRRVRTRLVDELGLEPGPELRRLEAGILNHDPRLQWTAPQLVRASRLVNQPRFVGRDRELSVLVTGVDDLRRRGGSVVFIHGEPGIGKTWLAEEGGAHAAGRGARVLVGRCWESDGAPAYWPWVQCLRGLVDELGADAVIAAAGPGAEEIATILPELGPRPSAPRRPPAVDAQGARFRLFDAVTALLCDAAVDRPLVIVLDDLHAADTASLLLLRFLAGALERAPVLVVATAREFGPATRELARSTRFVDLALGGLRRDEVRQMVGAAGMDDAAGALIDAIHARTEGHPFFVAELVRLLAAEGGLDAIPPGVRAVVGQRLEQLSPDCRRVLSVGAVAGREFAVAIVARAAGLGISTVLAHLDAAVAAHVVSPRTGGFRFIHALVREVLYDDLPGAERMRLHAAVGEALERVHGIEADRHVAELAHHFGAAAPVAGAEKSVRYAARAAEQAARELAYEESARLYERAVRAHDQQQDGDAKTRSELLLGLGAAQAAAGDMIAAREAFARAAAVARSAGLARELADAALGFGGALVMLPADDPRTVPLLEDALELIGDDGVLRARLLARLGCAATRPSLTQEALELAERLDDPGTLAWVLQARCVMVWGPDSVDEVRELAERITTAAERAGEAEQAVSGHLHRLEALLTSGRLRAAHQELAAATRLAHELRLPSVRWHVSVHETGLALLAGRYADAAALIEQAEALTARSSSVEATVTAAVQRFPLLLEQGRLAELRPTLQDIATDHPADGVYRCMLARLDVECGDRARARALFAQLAADGCAACPRDLVWLLAVPLLAETAAVLDDRRHAEMLYRLLVPYASLIATAPHFFSLGAVSRCLGVLAALLDRLDEAVAHMEAAVEINDSIGARPWAAHARAGYAGILLARGDRGDRTRACRLVAAARATYEELDMRVSAGRLAALTDRYGVTSGSRGQP
jgi:DNA-binding SARP family transcriptional activator